MKKECYFPKWMISKEACLKLQDAKQFVDFAKCISWFALSISFAASFPLLFGYEFFLRIVSHGPVFVFPLLGYVMALFALVMILRDSFLFEDFKKKWPWILHLVYFSILGIAFSIVGAFAYKIVVFSDFPWFHLGCCLFFFVYLPLFLAGFLLFYFGMYRGLVQFVRKNCFKD